jgi:hypothetical protein
MRYLFYGIILWFLPSAHSNAQITHWKNFADQADSTLFNNTIQPALMNLDQNPFLSRMKEWKNNTSISSDSLFYLLSNWNLYPTPKKTGIILKYELLLKEDYAVPYFVYIPEKYNPKNKTALLFYYKGGWLQRSQFPIDYEREIVKENPTFAYLDQYNVIEVFPALKNDLAIYGYYGYRHLEKMIVQTKKLFNIDDNKVYLSGFSDDGKTVYNAASLLATPFAAFYGINSFPPSTPAYLNFINRTVFSFAAENDELINWKSIYSKSEFVNRHGGNWLFHLLPGKKHLYKSYERDLLPLLFEHMEATRRKPLPDKIVYERSFNDEDIHGLDWIQIETDTKRKPMPGHFSDTVNTYTLEGEPITAIYGHNTGQVKAEYFDNTFTLSTSQIYTVTIYISPLMVNLNLPVKVIINGKVVFEEKVNASKAFMINRFINTFDRASVFVNQITVQVPEQ